MNQEILEKVYSFTAEQTGVPQNSLTPETTLEKDLGVTGDDGEEFMQAFSKVFGVDLSEFIFNQYFWDEYETPIALIDNWFGPLFPMFKRSKKREKIPIKIADLMQAVTNGRWLSPNPNGDEVS